MSINGNITSGVSFIVDDNGRVMGYRDRYGVDREFGSGLTAGIGSLLATDGNSITALNGAPITTSLAPQADTGWLNYGLSLSYHSLRWVEQRAVSGRTINDQRRLLSSWVRTTRANILSFLEGTNSIAGYVTAGMTDAQAAAQAWADMLVYLAEARSYGKFTRIILPTLLPRGSTASRNVAHHLFNERIRTLCACDPFYICVDFWRAAVSPTSTSLSAKSNYLDSADNLHQTQKLARLLGTEFARVINLLGLPPSSLIPVSVLNRSIDANTTVINSSPLMAGTAGTLLGTGTGTVASGWRAGVISGSATCVASIIADPDGYGSAQRIVASAMTSGTIVGIAMHITEALAYQVANDYFRGIAKVAMRSAANIDALWIGLAGFTTQAYTVNGFETTTATATVADFDNSDLTAPYYMSGPAVKFPGNLASGSPLTISVRARSLGTGAITLDMSQAVLHNLGQNPLLGAY